VVAPEQGVVVVAADLKRASEDHPHSNVPSSRKRLENVLKRQKLG